MLVFEGEKRGQEKERESTEGTSNDIKVSCKNKQLEPLLAHPPVPNDSLLGCPAVYFPSADSS